MAPSLPAPGWPDAAISGLPLDRLAPSGLAPPGGSSQRRPGPAPACPRAASPRWPDSAFGRRRPSSKPPCGSAMPAPWLYSARRRKRGGAVGRSEGAEEARWTGTADCGRRRGGSLVAFQNFGGAGAYPAPHLDPPLPTLSCSNSQFWETKHNVLPFASQNISCIRISVV